MSPSIVKFLIERRIGSLRLRVFKTPVSQDAFKNQSQRSRFQCKNSLTRQVKHMVKWAFREASMPSVAMVLVSSRPKQELLLLRAPMSTPHDAILRFHLTLSIVAALNISIAQTQFQSCSKKVNLDARERQAVSSVNLNVFTFLNYFVYS